MSITKKPNKILIVSRSNDPVSKLLKQWLLSLNICFVNLDYDTMSFMISSFEVNDENFKFHIDNKEYSNSEFKCIYFHRGALQESQITGIKESLTNVKDPKSAFKYYRMAYETSIKELTEFLIHNEKTIGRNNGGRINKLKMLTLAKKAGLNIPETLATTKKSELEFFFGKTKSIITKCLDINFIFNDHSTNRLLHALTFEVTIDDLKDLPLNFPLSVFQKNITKLIELRIFFIGEENFSAAIFSQISNNTQQDYRNYDDDSPSRIIPFNLPIEINEKINAFKKIANLKTGSIDIILTPENEYYFLEVNPQGQFMAISNYCNFFLEKNIVEFLNN